MCELFEMKVKVYVMQNITMDESAVEIAKLIDTSLLQSDEMKKLHADKTYMPYVMNSFYPIESKGIYKEGNIYTIIVRTISQPFKTHCENILCHTYTDKLKVLSVQSRKLRKSMIEKVYTITPVILKFENTGYWGNEYTIYDFERILKDNLFKKYKQFFGEQLNEQVELYNHLQFDNQKPVAMKYKNIKLLGDKLTIQVASNETAQKLFFMALGCGIGHNNSRGAGFINAKCY